MGSVRDEIWVWKRVDGRKKHLGLILHTIFLGGVGKKGQKRFLKGRKRSLIGLGIDGIKLWVGWLPVTICTL